MAWIRCNEVSGEKLEGLVVRRRDSRVERGDYQITHAKEIASSQIFDRAELASLDQVALERLQSACRLWDVRLRPLRIESHRPLLGKVIVPAKRVLFRILHVLLKDTLRQQRDFNGAVLENLIANCARNTEHRSHKLAPNERE